MKSPLKTFTLAALAVVLVSASAFAQFSPKAIWNLTISVNAPNAVIWVDNQQIVGGVVKVAGGAHNVKVHADGYYDFNGPVVVRGHQTFNVTLRPMGFPLTIRVNVPNATVILDGTDVTGTVPSVAPGSHSVQVSADGYRDYAAMVNVTGPMAVDVALQPAGFLLSINANVVNATISLNNTVVGPAPYSAYLQPGPYAVRVSAQGYVDYVANVSLDRPINLNVQLQPVPVVQPSTLSIVIPPSFVDPDMRPGDPAGQVKVFVDNRLANARRGELDRIVILPGHHQVRIASGAFSVLLGELVVQPSTNYTIELGMNVKVSAMKIGPQ